MFDTIAGLPLHPLVVHATEVIVPAAALAVLLAAVWPWFRRWAGYAPLGLAVVGLVLVPISTQSGEALEERVGESGLIETHAQLAEGMLPWMIGLVVVAAALLWWYRIRADAPPRTPGWLGMAVVVIALVVVGGTVAQSVRIGHSGAKAVWEGDVSSSSS